MYGFMSNLIALMTAKFRCVAAGIPQVTSLSARVAAGLIWTSDLYAAVNHARTATTRLLVSIWKSFLLMHMTVDSEISLHFVDWVVLSLIFLLRFLLRVPCVYIFGSLLILPLFRLLSLLTPRLWVYDHIYILIFAYGDDPWVVRCTPSLSSRYMLTDPLLTLKLSSLSMDSA